MAGRNWGRTGAKAAGLTMLLLASGCAVSRTAPLPVRPAPPPPAQPTVQDTQFAEFVASFRQTALAGGIAPEVYDVAMSGVRYQERILGHNASQPEFVKPIWTYLDEAVLPRIAPGRARIEANRTAFDEIEARYGVPKEIVASIWGNETDFGKVLGRYNLFSALATLSFRGPRVGYARPQLLAALTMLQEQKLDPAEMVSSWAGAFGQTQFVPTSFLGEAVDGDGDGKIDLWHSSADALASTAHMLADAGWARGQPWGYEVLLPEGFRYEEAELNDVKPLSYWRAMGVRRTDGSALASEGAGAIYLPAGAKGPAFLILPNFRTILKYNAAASYALAVCLLADRMKGEPELAAAWPRAEPLLSRAQRLTLQEGLKKLGFDPGPADGLVGLKTRIALRAFQKARGLPADGFATVELAARIAYEANAAGADQTATSAAGS